MAGFVVLVYVVVVIVAGTLLLGRVTPSFWLSVLATAIVALAFEPVRRRVKTALSGALHQDRPSPYQVLASPAPPRADVMSRHDRPRVALRVVLPDDARPGSAQPGQTLLHEIGGIVDVARQHVAITEKRRRAGT
jgi:hypothetical protein